MYRTRTLSMIAILLPLAGGCSSGDGENAPIDVETNDGAVNAGSPDENMDGVGTPEAPTDSPFSLDGPSSENDGVARNDDAPGNDEGSVPAAAMGDDGPNEQAPSGDGNDTSPLIGLWDYTRSVEAGTDVALFSIEADGVVTEYDYRDDAVGDGRPCHLVNTVSIASRDDDRYDIRNTSVLPGADSVDDVLITATDDEITFRYLGDVFDPEFGSGQAGITETYPTVSDRGIEDLVICES